MDSLKNKSAHQPRDFRTTHWSIVLQAADSESPERQTALTTLCCSYWYPLYAFVRRSGRSPQEAEDLTQSFFAHMLEKKALRSVGPNKGRFRSFLLASLKNFLANEWDKGRAVKRGGEHSFVSLDQEPVEERYLCEPRDETTPETLFEQCWAMSVIRSVLDQLRREYADSGRSRLFEEIHSYLEEEGAGTYAEIGAKLGMTEGAVTMAVLRLRENFRRCLRSEIAQTVAGANEIDEELHHLFACLSR